MPPSPKYTREEIVNAATELVRERGYSALTARDLGARLGTSSRPIFTAFENMEELKAEVIKKATQIFLDIQKEEIESGKYPPYKAVGMAYIRLAKEETNIFKLLFMRDRTKENTLSTKDKTYSNVIDTVKNQNSLSEAEADIFHAEMWICVHGIATMIATSYLDWDFEQISTMVTDMYEGLKARISRREENEQHN